MQVWLASCADGNRGGKHSRVVDVLAHVDAGTRSARDAGSAARARLVVGLEALPVHLNPLLASADRWGHRIGLINIVEPLVQRTAEGRFEPLLAERMGVHDEGRRYRFALRQGVLFSDGRRLTSTDVKATLDLLRGERSPNPWLRAELGDVERVNAPDPLVIEIKLHRASYLLPAVLAEVGIIPARLCKGRGPGQRMVGSGPYLRAAAQPAAEKNELLLVRNARFRGPAPAFKEVLLRAVPDPARALSALRNGEIDLLAPVYHGYYPKHVGDARFNTRFRLLRLHPSRFRAVLFNMRRRALRRPAVRQAIIAAIDRPALARAEGGELAQVLSAPINPESDWYDRRLAPRPHAPRTATRLLDAAGWVMPEKGGKVRTREGRALSLQLLYAKSSPLADATGRLRAAAAELGIDLRPAAADFGFLRVQVERGHFDLALLGLAYRPDADLFPFLHSTGPLNLGGYDNPRVDALLDSLRARPDAQERARIARRLHRALYDDPPLAVLYTATELVAANRAVAGLRDDGGWPPFGALSLAPAQASEESR